MNIISAIIFGALGMIIGWFVPRISQKIIIYKYNKKGKTLERDSRYTALPLKLICLLVSGALWAYSGLFSANVSQAIFLNIILIDAIIITLIDIRVHMIPNETVLIMAVAAIVLHITASGFAAALPSIIAMVAVMIVFTMLGSILGLDTIGAGDVKLAGAIGLVLGWPYIMYGMIGMSVLLILWCGGGLLTKKITLKSMLAFAPFMMGGTVIAILARFAGY